MCTPSRSVSLSRHSRPQSRNFWSATTAPPSARCHAKPPPNTSRRNGPDGIRTRTCDLDGVLCFHYTTGPQVRLSAIRCGLHAESSRRARCLPKNELTHLNWVQISKPMRSGPWFPPLQRAQGWATHEFQSQCVRVRGSHPCKERKDGAPSVVVISAGKSKGWATRPKVVVGWN